MTGFVERLKTMLPKSKFARSVGLLAGGTALAQAVTFLLSPLLTRLYTPEDFGMFAVFTSLLSLLVVAASLRYEWAIPLPKDEVSAVNLLSLSLLLVLSFSILVGFFIWIWGQQIAEWFNSPNILSVLWLLPFSLLGAGAYQALNFWTIRKQAYQRILNTKWKQSIGMSLVQVGCGILHSGTIGLALGDMVGRANGTGSLLLVSWRSDRMVFQKISFQTMREVARRYMRFPLFSSWSAILNTMGLQVPTLFLEIVYHSSVVGHFALAQNLLNVPFNMISNAVSSVYMAEMSKIVLDAPEKLERFFWKTVKNMLFGVPPIIVLAIIAPWMFSFVFGKEWREAGIFLQILTPMLLMSFLANSIGFTIIVLERQDLQAIRELIRLPLMGLAAFLSVFYSLPPAASLMVFSAVGTIGYFLHQFLSWLAIRKYVGQRLQEKEV